MANMKRTCLTPSLLTRDVEPIYSPSLIRLHLLVAEAVACSMDFFL